MKTSLTIVAAAVGVGLLLFFGINHEQPQPLPSVDTGGLEKRIAELEGQLSVARNERHEQQHRSQSQLEVAVINVMNSDASEMAEVLRNAYRETGGVNVAVFERINAVAVIADEKTRQEIAELIGRLDNANAVAAPTELRVITIPPHRMDPREFYEILKTIQKVKEAEGGDKTKPDLGEPFDGRGRGNGLGGDASRKTDLGR